VYVQKRVPGAQLLLSKHSPSTAIALCAAISSYFNDVQHSQESFLGATPPVKINWRVVHSKLAGTSLSTPAECQRLWKYIAYNKDVGTALATDTDEEPDAEEDGTLQRAAKKLMLAA
jgi:hypothetical protein